MDCLTFVSKLIESLAWPAVTLLIVYWLKDAIADRIKDLRKLKWGDKEANFGKLLEAAKEQAKAITAAEAPTVQREEITKDQSNLQYTRRVLQDVVQNAPQAAIIEAWAQVERQAKYLYFKWSGNAETNDPVSRLLDLQWREGTDEQLRVLMKNLRHLRNQAVHVGEEAISENQANEYVQLAMHVALALSKLVNAT